MMNMGFGRKLLIFIILVGIVFYLAYTYDKPLTCGLINKYVPSASQILGCQISFSLPPKSTITTNNITGYETNVFQNLTYKFNNASYGVNYTKQYELAKKANPNITNVVPFTNFTTNQAYLNSAYTEFSFVGSSPYLVNWNGVYIATYGVISGYYYKNGNITNYLPNLQGKIVTVEGTIFPGNTTIIKVPYLVKTEIIKNGVVYWNLTQATGVPNNNVTYVYNLPSNAKTLGNLIGIYYDGTEILFPRGD
jgi:hypothetical protein